MAAPTRFPGGVSTAARSQGNLWDYPNPDPTKFHVYFEDFDYYAAGDWTITGQGTESVALTDGNGGLLLLSTDVLDNDNCFLNKVGESFLLAAGKRCFFKARLKVSSAVETDFVVGLQITDTSPLDVTDGIYFLKADDAATIDVICRKNATTGSTSDTAIASVVTDTFIVLGFAYDGKSTITYYVDDVAKGTLDASSAYLPDTELTISVGIQAGSAGAKTLTVDYILAALER